MIKHLLPIVGSAWLSLFSVATVGAAPETINLRRTITVEIVQQTRDQVVSIHAKKIMARQVNVGPSNPFFGNMGPTETQFVPTESLGSGFVIHEDGYVVTNNHVVDRAREISVEFRDGRVMPAEIVSTDANFDLAVLKVLSPAPLSPIALGDSSDLMTGEPVIAVGNPLGFQYSVSTGVVSAVHRDLKELDQAGKSVTALTDLIQTDAAINPGNSGGPLLNAYGQVIGINTAIRGDAQLIGFAIPINRLRDIIPDLMNPAVVGQIDVPMNLKERRELTPPSVVKPTVVLVEGKENLAVSSIGGHPVRDLVDAYAKLLRYKPGETIEFDTAGGKRQMTATSVPVPDALTKAESRFGLRLVPVTPRLAATQKLSIEDGFLVEKVKRDSAGYKAGVQPGDILIRVGRMQLRNLNDLGVVVTRLPQEVPVQIGIVRGDQQGFTILKQ